MSTTGNATDMSRDGNEDEHIRDSNAWRPLHRTRHSGDNSGNRNPSSQDEDMDVCGCDEPGLTGGAAATSVHPDPGTDPNDAVNDASSVQEHRARSADAPHSFPVTSDQERSNADAMAFSRASREVPNTFGDSERPVSAAPGQHQPSVDAPRGGAHLSDGLHSQQRAVPIPVDSHSGTSSETGDSMKENRRPSKKTMAKFKKLAERRNKYMKLDAYRADIFGRFTVANLPPNWGSLVGMGPLDRLFFLRALRESDAKEQTQSRDPAGGKAASVSDGAATAERQGASSAAGSAEEVSEAPGLSSGGDVGTSEARPMRGSRSESATGRRTDGGDTEGDTQVRRPIISYVA